MLGRPRLHLRSTGSTNVKARELAEGGAPHGTLVTADEQTAGRGRQGRSWLTPPGTAIAASLIVREWDDLLPLRGGLAVADLAGPGAAVKWPNDVLLGGRKVAGILAEARAPDWAILGIGVNVTRVPPEVADIATALNRDAVEPALAELLAALDKRLAQAAPALLQDLRAKDALLGQDVRYTGGEGVGAGIDDAGQLLVQTPNGERVALAAGEVHLRG
jgi:BirA family biotin operon repressor/biotin-[acetyl-CoA-carboxylase] ligase